MNGMVNISCILCGSSKLQLLNKIVAHYQEKTYSLMKCSICGMIQIFPRPEKIYLDSFYDEYFDADPSFSAANQFKKMNTFDDVLSFIKALYPKSCTLLDLGCGNGASLEIAQKKYGLDVFGVDKGASACEVCAKKGIKTYCGELDDARFPDNNFDVVVTFHVIEHVLKPRQLLVEVNRILKKGGLFVVKTPNVDSKLARLTGPFWGFMNPPFHINYFTPRTLRIFLEDTGFSVENITTRFNPEYSFNFFIEFLFSLYRRIIQSEGAKRYGRNSLGRGFLDQLVKFPQRQILSIPTFIDNDYEIVGFARK